jgi:hypothetical protein
MQYFVATRDGSRLGLDELLGRMERTVPSRVISASAGEPTT